MLQFEWTWQALYWQKPVTKIQLLYDSIHMKVQYREIYKDSG